MWYCDWIDVVCSCQHSFHKRWVFGLAERLLASQEGLCFVR